MCGVAGILDRGARIGREALARQVGAMAQRLAHRGPDGRGVWVDETAGIALGHRRPAIIDPLLPAPSRSPRPTGALFSVSTARSITTGVAASMAVGLEVRVALLDHRIVELAWRLPASAKLARGTGKLVLRRILHRYVPTRLTARQKSGFAVPIGAWLRGPLRGWADDLLRRSGPADGDLVGREILTRSWEAHLSGRANHEYFLWNLLMLCSWFAHCRDEPALPALQQ
jgi:asparagine synthetase B (glutamine-hydrolysing)